MTPVLTAAHVVRRITADRPSVAERGAFGIRPEAAAAILRRGVGQTSQPPRRGRMRRSQRVLKRV